MQNYIGEIAALITAFCWTITALAFESASLKVGSIAVNIIRLSFAFLFLGIYSLVTRGLFIPVDATTHNWIWLSLSGLIGFVLGDLFLFESYTIVGSRISMLIMTTVPLITSAISFVFLGERLTLSNLMGMILVVSGIALVILQRADGGKKFKINHSLRGLLFAFLGAVGQSVGLVMSKVGMGDFDPFAATQIRVITGIAGFVIVISLWKKWEMVNGAVRDFQAMKRITLGSVFGPFLGVSLSLLAVQYTKTGIASTIMSIMPVLIIPPSIWLFKQKITSREVVGALISVIGVACFFLFN